jgi:hypothetical protein
MTSWDQSGGAGDAPTLGQGGTRTCTRCGTTYADWSMFCTQCGLQDPSTQPGTFQKAPDITPKGGTSPYGQVYRTPGTGTTSNSDSTMSIVFSILGTLLCVLFFIGAFSRARQARIRMEPNAQMATTVAKVCLGIYALLVVLNIVFFVLALQSAPEYQPVTTPSTFGP